MRRRQRCCVPGCFENNSSPRILHKFPNPNKESERFNQWVTIIGGDILGLTTEYISKYRSVCHDHFEQKYYCSSNRVSCVAIPTLNLPDGSMHIFPNPKIFPEKYEVWSRYLRPSLKELRHNYRNLRVCDIHFESQYKNRNNRLNALAVPTLHLPYPPPDTHTHNDHSYSKENVTIELPKVETPLKSNAEEEPSIDLPPSSRIWRPQINIPLDLPLFGPAEFSSSNVHDSGDEFNYDYSDIPSPVSDTLSLPLARTYLRIPTSYIPEENHESESQPPKAATAENKKGGPIFSWEKDIDLVPTDDRDVVGPTIASNVELAQSPVDITMYCDDDPKTGPVESEKNAEYKCNGCHKEIVGFRYTCVQCADWDLCGACEARAAHATHYMLRVPGPRPYNEIQAVLTAVRQQLLSENLFLHDETLTSIKLEPKDESDSENVQPSPACPDPLEEWISDAEEGLSESAEPNPSSSPRHKRRRTIAETQNQPLTPLRKPNMPRKDGGNRPRTESSIQSTNNELTRVREIPNILQRNEKIQPIITSSQPVNPLRRIHDIPFKENRPKSEKCSQTESWPIKKSVAKSPYILNTVHKTRLKSDVTVSNPSMQDHQRTQRNTPVKTMLYDEQTDYPEVLETKVVPRLFDELPKTWPTAYRLTGNLPVSVHKSETKVMRHKFSQVGRQRKITASKEVLQSNLIGRVSRQTVLLKIPSGTSALDLSKALQCQASVRIERLKKETIEYFIKRIK